MSGRGMHASSGYGREKGIGAMVQERKTASLGSVRWPGTLVKTGLVMAVLAAVGDGAVAQPARFDLMREFELNPQPVGAVPYNFCGDQEDEDSNVLDWELDRDFGWEIASSPYPEAGKPETPVTQIDGQDVEWQVARERFRARQYERCAAGLRESLDRLRAQQPVPTRQVTRVFRLLAMALTAVERLGEAAAVHREAIEFLQSVEDAPPWLLTDHRVGLAHVEQLQQLPADLRYEAIHVSQVFEQLPIPMEPQDFENVQQVRSRLRTHCGARSEPYRRFLTLYLMYVPALVGFNPPDFVIREFRLATDELQAAARSLYGEDHPEHWRALCVSARHRLMESPQPGSSEPLLDRLVDAASGWKHTDDVGPYELSTARVFALLKSLCQYYQHNNDRRGADRARLLTATFAKTHFGLQSWQYRNAWLEHRYGGSGSFYRTRAAAMCQQGDGLRDAKNYRDALAEYQQALDAVEKEFLTNPHPIRLKILERMESVHQRLAADAESSGDYLAAVKELDEALDLCTLRLQPGHWGVIDLKRQIEEFGALAKMNADGRAKAKELRLTTMSLGRGGIPAEAKHLFDVPEGERKQRISQLADAMAPLLAPDSPLLVDARLAIGAWYDEQGSLDRSQAIYEALLETARQRFGLLHPTSVELLLRLSEVANMLGDMDRAERLRGEAEAICIRLNFVRRLYVSEAPRPKFVESQATDQQVRQLAETVRLYFQRGHYVDALRHAVRLVDAAREVYGDGHREYAGGLTNLAAIHTELGDFGSAKVAFQRAVVAFAKSDAKTSVEYASCLHNMAVLLERLEQDAEALPLLEKEAKILAARSETRTVNYAHTLGTTSSILLRLKRFDDAKQKLTEAMALMQQVADESDPVHVQALHTLGFVALSLGAYDDSARLLKRVAEYWLAEQGEWSDQYAEAIHDLGALYDAQGKPAEAQGELHKALTVTVRNLRAAWLVQSERQQIEMITALRRRLDSLLSLAVRSPLDPASTYQDALLWKGAVLAGHRNGFPDLPARELQELQQEIMRAKYSAEELAIWHPAEEERDGWIKKLQEELEQQEVRAREVLTKYRDLIDKSPQREIMVDELLKSLPDNTVLIDYYQYRRVSWGPTGTGLRNAPAHLAAFVISRKREVQLVDLGPAGAVEPLIAQWRDTIGRRGSGAADATAANLRKLIWEPIEQKLERGDSLLIAPDGPLCLVPFAAVPGSEAGKYLIEERPVTMIASPQLLADARPRAEGKPSLLLVGDVDYASPAYEPWMEFVNPEIKPRRLALPDWRRLPGTRSEMHAIRGLYEQAFGEDDCKLLPGRLACETMVGGDLSNRRWIHIATHGFYADDLRPSYVSTLPPSQTDPAVSLAATWNLAAIHPKILSGLVLAGANLPAVSPHADGLLTAQEIEDFGMESAELVVLSACETGLGELRRGEGLLGLQRAFHAAGARNVMASLWQVDDAATRCLMENFYENLWKKNMPQAEALRQAQIAMLSGKVLLPGVTKRGADPQTSPAADPRGLKPSGAAPVRPDGRSPFFWAAFVLSGDGR